MSGGNGVRTEQKDMMSYINLIYIKEHTGGVGVAKKHIIHMEKMGKSKKNELTYSKPCVCGSFSHRTRRSLKCLLNSRYEDC